MRYILFLLIVGASVGFILYQMIMFLVRMGFTKGQMTRDMKEMQTEIQELKQTLVPFTSTEMELLSTKQTNKKIKVRLSLMVKGIFNTIYEEPLLAFVIKTYKKDQKLILITSSNQEFIYLIKTGQTHVYVDGEELGILSKDGKLQNIKNQTLATVQGDDALSTHPVSINGKDFGYVVNPKLSSDTNLRAFHLLRPMNADERTIFLSLTLLNLVEESL